MKYKSTQPKKLFDLFKEELHNKNLIANKGKIIDVSFVEVPIQRNSREENKQIKKRKIPGEWKKIQTNRSRKMWMRDVPKRMEKVITATKTISRPMRKANLTRRQRLSQ